MAAKKEHKGRKKGTPNKRSEEMRDKLEAIVEQEYGEKRSLPELLAILGVREMVSNDGNLVLAEKALNSAASYGYAKLKAIEHSGKLDTAPSITIGLA